MTQAELIKIIEQQSQIEMGILKLKGAEYSRTGDALANFKRISVGLDIPIEKVWCVFFMKHIDAIISFAKLGQEVSEETIMGRINDARNYLGILYAILEDRIDSIDKLESNFMQTEFKSEF